MKKHIFTLLLILMAVPAFARWDIYYSEGKLKLSICEVLRTYNNFTYRYIYDYCDSTFRIRIYPDAPSARRIFGSTRSLDGELSQPIQYIDVKIRFKGGPDGRQALTYRIWNPKPDLDELQYGGYTELKINDDGQILKNMRKSKKMEIHYYDFKLETTRAIDLSLKDFEKNAKEMTNVIRQY